MNCHCENTFSHDDLSPVHLQRGRKRCLADQEAPLTRPTSSLVPLSGANAKPVKERGLSIRSVLCPSSNQSAPRMSSLSPAREPALPDACARGSQIRGMTTVDRLALYNWPRNVDFGKRGRDPGRTPSPRPGKKCKKQKKWNDPLVPDQSRVSANSNAAADKSMNSTQHPGILGTTEKISQNPRIKIEPTRGHQIAQSIAAMPQLRDASSMFQSLRISKKRPNSPADSKKSRQRIPAPTGKQTRKYSLTSKSARKRRSRRERSKKRAEAAKLTSTDDGGGSDISDDSSLHHSHQSGRISPAQRSRYYNTSRDSGQRRSTGLIQRGAEQGGELDAEVVFEDRNEQNAAFAARGRSHISTGHSSHGYDAPRRDQARLAPPEPRPMSIIDRRNYVSPYTLFNVVQNAKRITGLARTYMAAKYPADEAESSSWSENEYDEYLSDEREQLRSKAVRAREERQDHQRQVPALRLLTEEFVPRPPAAPQGNGFGPSAQPKPVLKTVMVRAVKPGSKKSVRFAETPDSTETTIAPVSIHALNGRTVNARLSRERGNIQSSGDTRGYSSGSRTSKSSNGGKSGDPRPPRTSNAH